MTSDSKCDFQHDAFVAGCSQRPYQASATIGNFVSMKNLALRTQTASKLGMCIARYRGALVFPRLIMFAKSHALW